MIKATGEHDFKKKEVVEPTCVDKGYTLYVCGICGKEEHRDEVAATGKHSYKDEVVKAASCKESGVLTHTCTVCGHKTTESIPIAAHVPGEWQVVTEATETSTGLKVRTCVNCGTVIISDVIPKLENVRSESEALAAPDSSADNNADN